MSPRLRREVVVGVGVLLDGGGGDRSSIGVGRWWRCLPAVPCPAARGAVCPRFRPLPLVAPAACSSGLCRSWRCLPAVPGSAAGGAVCQQFRALPLVAPSARGSGLCRWWRCLPAVSGPAA
eukprot:g16277.t1